MGFKLNVDSRSSELSSDARKQTHHAAAAGSSAAPGESAALATPGALPVPAGPVAPTAPSPLVMSAAAATQPLPIGFPPPPAGYEIIFNSWASEWRRIHGNRAADHRLANLLRKLVKAAGALERLESPKQPSKTHLEDTAELRDIFRDSMKEAIANRKSIGDDAVKQAIREFKQASETHGAVVKDYEAKVDALCDNIEKFLVAAANPQPDSGIGNGLRQRTLFEGLLPIWVDANAAPSIRAYHHRETVPQAVRCSQRINASVTDLYRQLIRLPGIQDIRIVPRQLHLAQTRQDPRFLESENAIASFFQAEIVEPVAAVFKQLHPQATVRGIPGDQTMHADYFLSVSFQVTDDEGRSRHCCSVIAVEFKIPYGIDKEPARVLNQGISPLASQSSEESPAAFYKRQCDHAFQRAGLPTLNYGRHALAGQLCYYVRTTAIAPQMSDLDIAQHICRDFGVLSDFNRAWIVHFVPGTDELGELDDGKFAIEVSEPFYAVNGTPHPVFAYVYILDQIVQDMNANPAEYEIREAPISRQSQHSSRSVRKRLGRGHKRDLSEPSTSRASSITKPSRGKRQRFRSGPARKHKLQLAISVARGLSQARRYSLIAPQLDLLNNHCHASTKIELLENCPLTNPTKILIRQMKASSDSASNSEESDSSIEGHLLPLVHSKIWSEGGCTWQPLKGNVVIGRSLGSGRSGVVCTGKYNSSSVAFKCCPTLTRTKIVNEVINEAFIYDKLKPLQGDAIPKLLDRGMLIVQDVLYIVLVLENIQDCFAKQFSDRQGVLQDALTAEQKQAAVDVLCRIHQLGVCHGDPRAANILFESDEHGNRVPKIVDFAFSFIHPSSDELEEDLTEWRNVLGIS